MGFPVRQNSGVYQNTFLAIAFILAGGIALLYPTFSGKIVADTAALSTLPPWQQANAEPASDSISISQELRRDLPWRLFLSHSVRSGQSLFWNPLENCGMPFFALWRTRCLSPFTLPFYFMSFHLASIVSLWLKMTVAGLSAYYAARKFSISPLGACFTALAFECSFALVPHLGTFFSDAVPFLPLTLVAAECIAVSFPNGLLLLAFSLALIMLGGVPELALLLIFFVTSYALTRHREGEAALKRVLDLVPFLTGTVLLILGLTAVQILPFMEFFKESAPFFPKQSYVPRISDTITAVLPHFFGKTSLFPAGMSHTAELFFVTRAQVLMVLVYLSLRPFARTARKAQGDVLLFHVVVLTALSCWLPRISNSAAWTVFLAPRNLLALNAISLPIIVAISAEEWLELDADSCRQTLKRLFLFMVVAIVVLILGMVARFNDYRPYAQDLTYQCLVLAFFVLLFFLLLGATVVRPQHSLMFIGLSVLVLAEATPVFGNMLRFSSKDMVFPETEFISALRATNERISGANTLKEWPIHANLIPQTFGSSDFQLRRYESFADNLGQNPMLLRRMGARYFLLTKTDLQGPFAKNRAFLHIDRVFSSGVVLCEDRQARPRVSLTRDFQFTENFSPDLLTESSTTFVEGAATVSLNSEGNLGEAHIVEEMNTRIVISVSETAPALLVLADANYPGWKAFVDGKSVPIWTIDGFAKGVFLEESGPHEVVFEYKPKSFKIGAIISLLSLCLFVLLAVFSVRSRRT